MTLYLRIDDNKHFNWLKKIIDGWYNADPNDQRLQINYEPIAGWYKYLNENVVNVSEVIAEVEPEQLPILLDKTHVKKVQKPMKKASPPVDGVKRKGRPPSKQTLAARKQKEKAEKIKEKLADPFFCPDHPTYGGKNRISRDCSRCWDIYKSFHPADWKQAWNAFQRTKNKTAQN